MTQNPISGTKWVLRHAQGSEVSKYLQSAKEYIEWSKKEIELDRIANNAKSRVVKRGSVYWCDFGINIGSEQEGHRPCVVIQHGDGNKYSSNTIVAPVTHTKSQLDVVVPISDKYDANGKLILDGHVLLGNIVTVSKARLGDAITDLTSNEMKLIDDALAKSVDLFWKFAKYERILADKDEYIGKLRKSIENKDKEIERLSESLEKVGKN
jgi:mRNA interferase MazF